MNRRRGDRLWFVAVLGMTACGAVTFGPSRYLPQELSIVWSEQEEVTVFRWKLGERIDAGDVRFELVRDGLWTPIDFDAAPFPSGDYDCPRATCFLFSLRGRYQPPADGIVLRSVHAHHGTLKAGASDVEPLQTTLSAKPRFRAGNAQVALAIDDALSPANTPVRRRFRWNLVESDGACEPAPVFEAITEGVEEVPFRGQPSDAGRYCVTLQPVADDAGAAVTVAAEAFTHPVLEAHTLRYVAPHEKAPVYLQVIVDLEIPNATRCEATVAKVQERLQPLLRHGPGGGHAFEPIWLAQNGGVKCRQDASARLDAASLAETIKQYANQHAPGRFGAVVVFVYLSNLALPMRVETEAALVELVDSFFLEPLARASLWVMSNTTARGEWEARYFQTAWTSPFDKAFEDLVKTYDTQRFPVRSSLHRATDRIELASAGSVGGTDVLFKHCSATPVVRLKQGDRSIPTSQVVSPVLPGEPISFTVDLEPATRVEAVEWSDQVVTVRYELCRRWCTHPFESATGQPQPAWTTESRCREAP